STYWREEVLRLDHNFTNNVTGGFRYIHHSWGTTLLTPQWGAGRNTLPPLQNKFVGPGTSIILRLSATISPRILNEFVASYTTSPISLTNENGPGQAHFQRDHNLDQPLIASPGFPPGQCDPTVSVDPLTGLPQCSLGYFFKNGFGGKMPGLV